MFTLFFCAIVSLRNEVYLLFFITESLPQEARDFFKQHLRLQHVKKNTRFTPKVHYPQDVIFSISGAFSIIKSGLRGREKILYILKGNEMLSTFPIALADHTEFCKTLIDSEIALINQQVFKDFLIKYPLAALQLISYQEKVQSRLKRQIKNFNLPVKDRLLARLWKLDHDFGHETELGWSTIHLPLSMQTLADFLGSNRETISRLMHELQNENYIKIKQKTISLNIQQTIIYLKSIK